MNVEFFYHGVTDAFHEWGTISDSMQNHYNKAGVNEPVRFAIEIGKTQQQYCVYYSYLRYDLVDSTSRPGAYFGFTIRFDDVYCKDASILFNICDDLFNSQILNNIIRQQGNTAKYLIKKFEEKQSLLENINQMAAEKIEHLSFAQISTDLVQGNKHNAAISYFNVKEVDSPYFWQKFAETGKVVASPYFQLKDKTISDLNSQVQPEKEKSQRLSIENENLKSELKSTTENYRQLETKSTEAQKVATQTINAQKERLEKLEVELQNKNKELMQRRQTENISQLISIIQKPIKDLAAYFQVGEESVGHTHTHKQTVTITTRQMRPIYLTVLLSIAILIVCSFLMFGQNNKPNETSQNLQSEISRLKNECENTKDGIGEKQKEIERLNRIIEEKDEEISELKNKKNKPVQKPKPAENKKPITTPNVKQDTRNAQPKQEPSVDFKLEIKPADDSLVKGKQYTISVIGYNGPVEEWRFDNCNGDKNAELQNKITIGNADKDAIVTFVPKGMSVDDARKKQMKKPVKSTNPNE